MLTHDFPFDPSYGYDLAGLLAIAPPEPPADFAAFWQTRYTQALTVDPDPSLTDCRLALPGVEIFEVGYRSTDEIAIRGWLAYPRHGMASRGLILGHGYGGIDRPRLPPICAGAAYLVPCFRGLGLSRCPPISDNPSWHVLHDIDQRDRYILGGCVADLWCATTALLALCPEVQGRIGYLGISFGGGIGALAMPWEPRIQRWHLNVPSFGHQPLRLELPSIGSAASVRRFQQGLGGNRNVLETLQYYDGASAARWMERPVHLAAARFDPAVAPPGQFAIYNALPGDKRLFVLDAGHFDYPNRGEQEQALLAELKDFIRPL